jgi:hypothetical protein
VGNERRAAREGLNLGALLTLGEAEALLPVADRLARAWLLERGLVRYLRGRPVVLWQDVMDELRKPDTPQPDAKPRPRLRLERKKL